MYTFQQYLEGVQFDTLNEYVSLNYARLRFAEVSIVYGKCELCVSGNKISVRSVPIRM